jgi:hypothetical protein
METKRGSGKFVTEPRLSAWAKAGTIAKAAQTKMQVNRFINVTPD